MAYYGLSLILSTFTPGLVLGDKKKSHVQFWPELAGGKFGLNLKQPAEERSSEAFSRLES